MMYLNFLSSQKNTKIILFEQPSIIFLQISYSPTQVEKIRKFYILIS